MTEQKNELVEVIQIAGLEQNKVESLMSSFSLNYASARKLIEASRKISVLDENDKAGMQNARESRLKLRQVRIDVEKTRVSLKEQSLRESRAIDGAANIIKALIVPVEEHLEQLEKTAELVKQNRELKIIAERAEKLREYVVDVSIYRLEPDNMSDEIFNALLTSLKTAKDAETAARVKAEADRVEEEKKNAIIRDRQIEIAPYLEYLPTDVDPKTVHARSDNDYGEILKKAKSNKGYYLAEQEKIRQNNELLIKEAKAKDEKLAKEKADREKIEKQIAEDKERERLRLEAEQKAKNDAERAKLLAPDKEKLLKLANDVELFVSSHFPSVSSKKANETLNYCESKINAIADELREGAKQL